MCEHRISRLILICLLAMAVSATLIAAEQPVSSSKWTLWYEHPAKEWVEALPIGNGRLGAMVFGGVDTEHIQFNEDTLWTGIPRDYSNPDAHKYLAEVRRLLFEGKQAEAEKIAEDHMMSIPLRQETYQPFGDVWLSFPNQPDPTDYRRSLDLDSGIAAVRYRIGKTTFTQEFFASAPDNVIVGSVRADTPGSLTMTVKMDSPHTKSTTVGDGPATLVMWGKVNSRDDKKLKKLFPSALNFESRLKLYVTGGSIKIKDGVANIDSADSVYFALAAATTYVNYHDVSGNPSAANKRWMAAVDGLTYRQLRDRHVVDHRNLFRRVDIDLGSSEADSIPTDKRITRFIDKPDPSLAALYFQYGRYLLMSSSRPGSQPANLQGIWNYQLSPPWGSKWTVNINTEMNYWPVEVTNLSECHEPLFDMLADLAKTGQKTARNHYDCRGWVLHHNTDLWRGTAPINASNHGIWPTGGAWLTTQMWDHYRYTLDKKFLRDRAYPIMREAAQFFLDFLVKDPTTGYLISTPSNSPEHGGLVAGPTMDHEIIRDLFADCIEASKILDIDKSFRHKLETARAKIAPFQIGRYGQLQEWMQDKDNPKDTHRHVSHLYAVYPSEQITLRKTPKLAAAAKKSLEFRTDIGTGWSLAWKVNLWDRFEDGNHAYKLLHSMLTPSTKNRRGGSYPNLFDAHPPFQIDGNFGAAAGIAGMLMQSHSGEIHLLPALPDAWPTGYVRGLRARGAFQVDVEWKDGTLKKAVIFSDKGTPCTVRYGDSTKTFDTEPGRGYIIDRDLNVRPASK